MPIKMAFQVQIHSPGEASLCTPIPTPTHLQVLGKLTVGKIHLAQITNCLGCLLLFPVCVSCLPNHTGALSTHWRNCVASFSTAQHSSMYKVRGSQHLLICCMIVSFEKAFGQSTCSSLKNENLHLTKCESPQGYPVSFHCTPTSTVPCPPAE